MPHTRPSKPSVTLIHRSVGDLVQVHVQDRDVPSTPGAGPIRLRKGDVVQCLRNDEHGVLIARGDGSRILVPVQSARMVGIRWFPDSLVSDESIDGHSPRRKPNLEGRAGSWRSRPRRLKAGRLETKRVTRRTEYEGASRSDP
jgi:hypothetical protein